MRQDFAGLEQAAFWLYIVIALVLVGYLIRGKNPGGDGWVKVVEQKMPTI
ncbi:hypothetical protein PQR02_18665 [Paraburkholderia sediminicola]|uniref:Uncharacterized protein n=1 Tax=Paraburkholderia rhynchosiae TaxID=487049 RepID=A0ACC7NAG0_9BURK